MFLSTEARIPHCRTSCNLAFGYPLHNLQRHFVSNAVSNAKEFEHSAANFSGQEVLRFDEIWSSESGGE